jgi:hypothetical protein
MPIPIFKIFMVFGLVSAWAAKALEDGKITLDEAADLGEQLGRALGIPTSIEIPQPTVEVEKVEGPEEHEEGDALNPIADKLKAFATPTPIIEGGEES